MKGIAIKFFFLILITSLHGNTSQAQNQSLFSSVRNALESGSSKELSQYFNDTIELNIDGESGNYSKAHAEIYLKEFFKNHKPISFKYVQLNANEDLKYAIGDYIHSEGGYLVLIRVKEINGKEKIYIINFRKQ